MGLVSPFRDRAVEMKRGILKREENEWEWGARICLDSDSTLVS